MVRVLLSESLRSRVRTRAEVWMVLFTIVAGGVVGCGPKPHMPAEPPPPEEAVVTPAQRLELARKSLDEGRLGEAADRYREILEYDPEDFEANLNLGIAILTMERAKFENERDYTEAQTYFRRALEMRQDEAAPNFYLGAIEFERENYPGAIERLSVATGLDPGNEQAHEMLGLSLIEAGSEDAGERELLKTLELNPQNPAANLALGRIYEKEDRNDLAMELLEKALDANPNLDMATYILERVYYEERLYEQAEARCRQFLEYHPDDIQSLEILGWIYRLGNRTEDMLDIYERLVRIQPENTAYWSPMIQYYMQREDYRKARGLLETSLKYNPYYAYGNVQYGQVLMHYGERALEDGKPGEAIGMFRTAVEHLRKARIDDRYAEAAGKLISRAEERIRGLSGG
jgi:tetratricopeptide (TPR) repeat protein